MTDTTSSLPLPSPRERQPLSEIEVQRLSRWAQRSTMPAWPTFDPSLPHTPPETILRLIGEWHAMKAVLELTGEFAGDLCKLLKRIEDGQ